MLELSAALNYIKIWMYFILHRVVSYNLKKDLVLECKLFWNIIRSYTKKLNLEKSLHSLCISKVVFRFACDCLFISRAHFRNLSRQKLQPSLNFLRMLNWLTKFASLECSQSTFRHPTFLFLKYDIIYFYVCYPTSYGVVVACLF